MAPQSRWPRLSLLFGTLLAFLTFRPLAALGHAYVSTTSPQTNGTLATSPNEISVTFDEPVSVESPDALIAWPVGGANVDCAGGSRSDFANPRRIVCRLAKPLAKGAYIVSWRVTSNDTHVVHGVFSFGIGVAVHGEHGETPSLYDPSGALAVLLRWLSLAGTAALAGALAFDRFVLRAAAFPASQAAALESLRGRCRLVGRTGLIAALLGSFGSLDVQAAAAIGSSWLGAFPAFGTIVATSKWGLAWAARTIALVSIALIWRRQSSRVALVLAGIVVLTFSLSGHAVATDQTFQRGLRVLADWLHLAATALWSGGLLVLAAGVRPALNLLRGAERAGFIRTAISRFSVLATVAVATIVATGIYAAAVQVHAWPDLVATTYGRIVLAKVALLLPLLALGYRHYRQGQSGSVRFNFASSLALEACLLLVVIGLSATLSGLAPPFPKPVQMEE